jgi:hypothetical protein
LNHLPEFGVQKGFTPTLQKDQVGQVEVGLQTLKGAHLHKTAPPLVLMASLHTVGTRGVADRGHLHLNAVKMEWYEYLGQLFKEIFQHSG